MHVHVWVCVNWRSINNQLFFSIWSWPLRSSAGHFNKQQGVISEDSTNPWSLDSVCWNGHVAFKFEWQLNCRLTCHILGRLKNTTPSRAMAWNVHSVECVPKSKSNLWIICHAFSDLKITCLMRHWDDTLVCVNDYPKVVRHTWFLGHGNLDPIQTVRVPRFSGDLTGFTMHS